ncbi:hypothetical protein QTI51_24615 [Variovorax sp. J22G73]|uniref:hypothetical protein n=1 Tax=unclassified Variovorax TaxID=663243 RepID=UPI00257714F3|nr:MULTISPECIES: hypothetical protein [unclassified Variovorax]MDM0007894.1 hypothetical protein [Variovorax sp. J22R203]MDM0100483.1 hypothetical protein [Variovorax sp. J22G73]
MIPATKSDDEASSQPHEPKFYSEWSDPTGALVLPDPQRHDEFVAYAKQVIAILRPHLLLFLAGGRARVLLGQGIFCFDLPAARGTWIEVEDVATRLKLLPWVEPNEVMH